jgi:hypothetical protein
MVNIEFLFGEFPPFLRRNEPDSVYGKTGVALYARIFKSVRQSCLPRTGTPSPASISIAAQAAISPIPTPTTAADVRSDTSSFSYIRRK